MGRADHYVHGDNNAICDRCGRKYKASQLKKEWNGLYTCPDDWEPRHPQDLIKSSHDDQRPALSRPEGADTFITEVLSPSLGNSWQNVDSGVSVTLRSVYGDSSIWIVVGDGGTILTASVDDPTTWTARVSGVATSLRTVKKFKGTYFIVGWGNGVNPATVLSSTDGITWTTIDIGGGASHLVTIGVMEGEKMLFGGYDLPFVSPALIVSTTDGVNFTRNTYASFHGVYGIAHDGTTWGIVGSGSADDLTPYYATSSDGTTLTAGSTSNYTYSIWNIIHNGTNWVSSSGNGDIKYSSDGISWAPAISLYSDPLKPNFNPWRVTQNTNGDMIISGGFFVGVLLRSTDSGLTWAKVYENGNAFLMSKAWFSQNYWVAVGWNGALAYSI